MSRGRPLSLLSPTRPPSCFNQPSSTLDALGRRAYATTVGASARGRRWDAIIVGGGHNGLVAAAYLAKVRTAQRPPHIAIGQDAQW